MGQMILARLEPTDRGLLYFGLDAGKQQNHRPSLHRSTSRHPAASPIGHTPVALCFTIGTSLLYDN